MLMGFGCAKAGLFGKEAANWFSVCILKLTLPALQITSLQRPFSWELLGQAGRTMALSLGMYIFFFLLAFLYTCLGGFSGSDRGVHRYGVIFSNCGFLGYPMVEAVLGSAYLFHAVVYNIPFNLLAYSVGAGLIAKAGRRGLAITWRTFINPIVGAALGGFGLFIFSISLPEVLYLPLKMLGDITTPLSMLVIGISLAQVRGRHIFGTPRLYVTVLMRLAGAPALWAGICWLAGVRGELLILAVLIGAMPIASTTSILASLYGVSGEEASCLVFLSTLLCVITVPGWIFLIRLVS